MVVTLHIAMLGAGIYQAWPAAGGVEIAKANFYSSIEESIRTEANAIPESFSSEFLEIRYADLSSGTLTVGEAIQQAASIADRFDQLVGISRG